MKKYILVTGGELRNKGAQAMTFITVDQIAKKFPDYKVVLLDGYDYGEELTKNLKFQFAKLARIRYMLNCLKPWKNPFPKKHEVSEIFNNLAGIVDISGYRLGSNWPDHTVMSYIRTIFYAKHLGVPVYLMPQSFGPFEFKGKNKFILNTLIKRYLKYPKFIMAREQEGYDWLTKKYKLKNVIKTPDLVLQNTGIDLANIYHKIPETFKLSVHKNSIALIPNSKNNKFGNKEEIMILYKNIVDMLLGKEKYVYLLYHAKEDLSICREIKDLYSENENVILVEQELGCIEYGDCVGKFDYIIGSRYHSIVHAYKEYTPAIVFGWATKYRELAEMFGQEGYCFDVRNSMDTECILNKIEIMSNIFDKESQKIKKVMNDVQSSNVYDYLEF